METHGRDLRFLALFGLLMVVYSGITSTESVKDRFFPWYLELNAKGADAVVHLFGYEDMHRKGKSLISPRGSITVERGCDAMAPCALFVSAVLASPVPFMSRVLASLVGTALLLVINLFRIITLFLAAVHWKSAFNVLHLEVWQSAFIFLAILLWAIWAAWESARRRRRASDA